MVHDKQTDGEWAPEPPSEAKKYARIAKANHEEVSKCDDFDPEASDDGDRVICKNCRVVVFNFSGPMGVQ